MPPSIKVPNWKLHLLIHLFNIHVLIIFHLLESVLVTGDSAMNKTNKKWYTFTLLEWRVHPTGGRKMLIKYNIIYMLSSMKTTRKRKLTSWGASSARRVLGLRREIVLINSRQRAPWWFPEVITQKCRALSCRWRP